MHRSRTSSPHVQVNSHTLLNQFNQDESIDPLLYHRWFKEQNEQLTPIKMNERIFIVSGGLLKISKARIGDAGKYLCWVNNTGGEETSQVLLTILGNISSLQCVRPL